MKTKVADLIFNLVIVAVGVYCFILALSYPYYDKNGDGISMGFFAVWISALMVVFALLRIFIQLPGEIKKDTTKFIGKQQAIRFVIFFLMTLVYITAIEYLGMLTATLIYAFVTYKFFDKLSWKASVFPAIGVVICLYLIFIVLLRLRLPLGVVGLL
jgi:hypothetical protein